MSKTLVLNEYIKMQQQLDEAIGKERKYVDFNKIDTHYNLKLALIVELSELANFTQCFKMWRAGYDPNNPLANARTQNREDLLEEVVDVVHFLLSFTYRCGFLELSFDVEEDAEQTLASLFVHTNAVFSNIDVYSMDKKQLLLAWQAFLEIVAKLHISPEELTEHYKKKHKINYERLKNNY